MDISAGAVVTAAVSTVHRVSCEGRVGRRSPRVLGGVGRPIATEPGGVILSGGVRVHAVSWYVGHHPPGHLGLAISQTVVPAERCFVPMSAHSAPPREQRRIR
jgi:hypothetical protein